MGWIVLEGIFKKLFGRKGSKKGLKVTKINMLSNNYHQQKVCFNPLVPDVHFKYANQKVSNRCLAIFCSNNRKNLDSIRSRQYKRARDNYVPLLSNLFLSAVFSWNDVPLSNDLLYFFSKILKITVTFSTPFNQ